MNNPTSNVSQIKHEEFLFLGKEYPCKSNREADYGKIFDDFFAVDGYGVSEPYLVESCKKPCVDVLVFHRKSPEECFVHIGKMVEGVSEAPEGYAMAKYPACEFLLVTTEWLPTESEAHKGVEENVKNAQLPDGYVRDDGPDGRYILIEKMFADTEKGHRWERWIPIKKID
jgi:hypothetical protein